MVGKALCIRERCAISTRGDWLRKVEWTSMLLLTERRIAVQQMSLLSCNLQHLSHSACSAAVAAIAFLAIAASAFGADSAALTSAPGGIAGPLLATSV